MAHLPTQTLGKMIEIESLHYARCLLCGEEFINTTRIAAKDQVTRHILDDHTDVAL